MNDWTPEDIKRYEQRIDAYASTKGRRKMWNYFLEVSKKDYFINKIKALREQCAIPEGGFDPAGTHHQLPPEGYNSSRYGDEIREGVDDICRKYSLHRLDWFESIEIFLFYDELEDPIWNANAADLCLLADLAYEKKDPSEESTQEDDNLAYPIAIRISPYASQRDIIDFVKKTYKHDIKPWQDSYKQKGVKIGKVKGKKADLQKRNEFIYQNRHLPRRRIMQMLMQKFGEQQAIDYGYIGKIISLENKKRKEV